MCGIEAHICVSQTVHDLLASGVEVHVAARRGRLAPPRRPRGRLEQDGARRAPSPSSVETALFELCERGRHGRVQGGPAGDQVTASAYLLLEDGTRMDGDAVGAERDVTGEVVFTTGMSGYQESMTDPSFARQLITFTVPHVGNYGVSEAAMESGRIHAAGAIMRDARQPDRRRPAPSRAGWTGCAPTASRASAASTPARSSATSATRGRCAAGSSRAGTPQAEAMERVRAEPSMVGRDLAREVTVREPEIHGDGDGPRIIALDTGIKRSIIRNFTSAARRSSCTRARPRRTSCSPAIPTASSSCPAPATRPRSATSSRRSASCSSRSRCSASASATSCSRARPAWRPSSCRSATAAPTTRSRTCAPAGSRSPRRTTASPSRARSACGSSPSSAPPSSPT